MSKRKRGSKYDDLSLPHLYKLCVERGIEGYFPKLNDEVINMLIKWDNENVDEYVGKGSVDSNFKRKGKSMSKKKDVEELDLDELDEDLEVDEDDFEEESVTDRVKKKIGLDDEEDDSEDEEKDDSEEDELEDDEDDEEDDEEDELEDDDEEKDDSEDDDSELDELSEEIELEDEEENEMPEEKETKKVVKKKATKKSSKSAPEKKATKKSSNSAPEKKAVNNAAKGRRVTNDDAPYVSGTAGYIVYKVLTKCTKGATLEAIAKKVDDLLEKKDIKKPANTSAKIKVIAQELKSGKKDKKWGSAEYDRSTSKYKFIPAE